MSAVITIPKDHLKEIYKFVVDAVQYFTYRERADSIFSGYERTRSKFVQSGIDSREHIEIALMTEE
jgi:hypothetical protein